MIKKTLMSLFFFELRNEKPPYGGFFIDKQPFSKYYIDKYTIVYVKKDRF